MLLGITCCRCSSDNIGPRLTSVLLTNQVEKWEKIDPHQIDKVPIQPDVLHRTVIFRAVGASCPGDDNPSHQSDADNHVQRVQSGHRPVQREINLDVLRIYPGFFGTFELEIRSGELMVDPVLVVLDALDTQKPEA